MPILKSQNAIERRRTEHLLWFATGVAATLPQLLHPWGPGFGRGWEMLNVARALATTGRFADPFMTGPTGLTATVPPAYPVVLGLLAWLFGAQAGLMWSAMTLELLLHGLYAVLLVVVGERLTGSRAAGRSAALTACLLPAFPLIPQWDMAFSTVALLLVLALPAPAASPAAWLGRGALAGALALCNPVPASVALLRALAQAPRSRVAFRLLAAWAIGATLLTGPWMLRNHLTLGTWALRTNFGIALYTSNNACAEPSFFYSFASGCYHHYQVNNSMAEAAQLRRLGEVAYNQRCLRLALDWMRANPGRALALTAARIREFWFPPLGIRFPYTEAFWATSLLGLAGCMLLLRARRSEAGFIVLVLCLAPAPYLVVVSDLRYSAQLVWMAQICAGWLLAQVVARFRTARGRIAIRASRVA
jgi:hypothetical protein